MSCLTSAQITAIKAEIAELEILLTAINAAYLSSLGNAEIAEYRFNSGDGNQMAIRRSPKQLRVEWENLKSSKAALERQLAGTSNVNMNLRRRRGGYANYR